MSKRARALRLREQLGAGTPRPSAPCLAHAPKLAGAKLPEVLGSLRHQVREQLHLDPPHGRAPDGEVEEDDRVGRDGRAQVPLDAAAVGGWRGGRHERKGMGDRSGNRSRQQVSPAAVAGREGLCGLDGEGERERERG